ncbi:MAG: hypothetical protein IJJ44_08230 [Solobacterium sp.]|nr:hypothetical protein [Solobacterium sp.]
MSALRTVITTETKTGGYLTSLLIDQNEVLVYQPKDLMESDIINHGYSAPLLLVFGEGRFTGQEAVSYAEETKLAQIAQENGGTVIFVNPKDTWDTEEEGVYERVLSKARVSQWGFSHGILYDEKIPHNRFEEMAMKRPGFDPVPEYFIFGSPVATYVYTKGAGADYFARYYLKEVKGQNAMGDLGFADITMTAVTLENLSVLPEVTCKDVSIVSVNNSEEINRVLLASDNRTAVCDTLDVVAQYDAYIGDYKRWAGKIRKSVNYRKEGIIMRPQRMFVQTSPDNVAPKVTRPEHEVGYVLFYGKDLDLHDPEHPVPLLLCFHGGGDTAIATAIIGQWPEIARENGFILCAVEMHLEVTATETLEIVRKLESEYAIDKSRIYVTGFSMGGIKSWDFCQEYPEVIAAAAPMDATVDVGENTQFTKAWKVNQDILVPVFYNGGEESPLAETAYQEGKCMNRFRYTFKINCVVKPYDCRFEERDQWEDKFYGVSGDITEVLHDPDFPMSETTVRYYRSDDGNIYTAFCSISNHKHEIRPFTCRLAWNFLKQFRRNEQGEIEITA